MQIFRLLLTLAAAALSAAAAPENARAQQISCPAPGSWSVPGVPEVPAVDRLVARLAQNAVVILGEKHGDPAVHRWQLHMLAALYAHRPDMAVAFEAFPRAAQPALDRWVAGEIDPQVLLRETRYGEVWGVAGEFYMPLFYFPRMHRLPMVAMNVERAVVRRVGEKGLGAVPPAEREGIGDPAPAGAPYRQRLRAVLDAKTAQVDAEGDHGSEGAGSAADQGTRFERFVEAQSLWDRAFAEAIAGALGRDDVGLVAVVVGRGHAEYGDGLPAQLAALGVSDVAVLLTQEADGEGCDSFVDAAGRPIADAVFGLDAAPAPVGAPGSAPDRPRLGVVIEAVRDGEPGVRVVRVAEDSVAAAAGIQADDVIVTAAGTDVAANADLIAIVGRQAPGTWLPLQLRRAGETVDIVAKFPPR